MSTKEKVIARLTELNEKGLSKVEMARVANVSKQAVTGWFKTGKISKESAVSIADAAGVSVPWLLGEDLSQPDELRRDEQRLVDLYRQLSGEEQRGLIKFIRGYIKGVHPSGK